MAAALALTMALPVLAAEAEDMTGEWYLQEALFGSISVSPYELELFITLTLNEDGTAVFAESEAADGEPEITECPWTMEDGNILITRDEQELLFEVEDNELHFDNGMSIFVFGREPLADLSALPEQVAITDEEVLFGTWQSVAVLLEGDDVVRPAFEFGVEGNTFSIEEGKYLSDMFVEDTDVGYVIQNGELQITLDGNPFMSPCYLTDNGWLGRLTAFPVYNEDGEMETDEDGNPVMDYGTLFFEKVDAE